MYALAAQVRRGGGDIGLNSFGRRLLDVRHVLEVVAALLGAGRATEVIERDRSDPALREAQRKLLVEAVETAHVRQNHDTDLGSIVRDGGEGGEPVAITRFEHELVVRDGGAADRRDRRNGVELEAHPVASLAPRPQKTPGNRSSE